MQGADLTRAHLQGAVLGRVQLQGARLETARLQGAFLRRAQLQDADLAEAQLQGAFLWQAQLQGAFLWAAQLQGAVLTAAQLQKADLQYASLQGAELREAQLQGADLDEARLQGADLRETAWWRAQGLTASAVALADAREREVAAVTDPRTWIDETVAKIDGETARAAIRKRLRAWLEQDHDGEGWFPPPGLLDAEGGVVERDVVSEHVQPRAELLSDVACLDDMPFKRSVEMARNLLAELPDIAPALRAPFAARLLAPDCLPAKGSDDAFVAELRAIADGAGGAAATD